MIANASSSGLPSMSSARRCDALLGEGCVLGVKKLRLSLTFVTFCVSRISDERFTCCAPPPSSNATGARVLGIQRSRNKKCGMPSCLPRRVCIHHHMMGSCNSIEFSSLFRLPPRYDGTPCLSGWEFPRINLEIMTFSKCRPASAWRSCCMQDACTTLAGIANFYRVFEPFSARHDRRMVYIPCCIWDD